ncbi:MAG: HAD-IC family P-type ATPase, partial [Clostridia bacterium]|nr:HAD-IC family P-type ATPase [Clostridia bacterium]
LNSIPERTEKLVRDYAQQGLRVLVLAFSAGSINGERVPANLRPVALITLSDNVREDAAETSGWFKENGVGVKVISGDNPVTVSEVARRAGVADAENYVSLEGLAAPEVENAAMHYTVFGRVTPEQKAILIKTFKKAGHTVAMTGDGVNDILAMKEADCAISGASGSDAARQVSNLVLADDNFANMPKVVYEGRRLINNVKSTSALYIMKTLFIALMAIICIAFRTQYFFIPGNLLCFEGLVAGLPSIILSQQPNSERLHGKYFSYVLSHALPAAITMTLAVMTTYIVSMVLYGSFIPEYRAASVLVLTFAGVIMLYRLCKPLNLLRAVTLAGSFALCIFIFSVPVLANLIIPRWESIEFSREVIILIVCILEGVIPVSGWIFRLSAWIENFINNEPLKQ